MIKLLGFVLLAQAPLVFAEDAMHENLRGLHFLHMQIDESLDQELTAMERLDLADIMELQLRRGAVDIRQVRADRPEIYVPVAVLSIDTSERLKTGVFELVLQVRDRVIIKRNQSEVVATTFELRRSGRADSNEVASIKAVLRELMADFVDIYREQNPLLPKPGEKKE